MHILYIVSSNTITFEAIKINTISPDSHSITLRLCFTNIFIKIRKKDVKLYRENEEKVICLKKERLVNYIRKKNV